MAQVFDPVVMTKAENIWIANTARIDSFVKIEGGQGVTIGEYVHIASFAHLNIGGGELWLHDYSAVASSVLIVTGSNMMDALTLSACAPADMQRIERGKVVVYRYATLFAGVKVAPNVTIGEGAIAALGAVVTKDIPAWEVWGGVPARFMRKRTLAEKWEVMRRTMQATERA